MKMAGKRLSDIDIQIGNTIRSRRLLIGVTQQQLADKVGVTYQQMHKYERGVNRVSAARLLQIANALGVPPSALYEGLTEKDNGFINRGRAVLDLVTNFNAIDEAKQHVVMTLARTLAAAA